MMPSPPSPYCTTSSMPKTRSGVRVRANTLYATPTSIPPTVPCRKRIAMSGAGSVTKMEAASIAISATSAQAANGRQRTRATIATAVSAPSAAP